MAEFIVAKVLVKSKSENPDAIQAQETLMNLRGGINKLSFTEQEIAELLHRVDKDGLKRIRSRWGYKARKDASGNISTLKTPMEVYVTDIARSINGMEYLEEMHPVDAFLEIDSMYERAQEDANKTTGVIQMDLRLFFFSPAPSSALTERKCQYR